MLNAFVDPVSIACPTEEAGRDGFFEYAASLLSWRRLLGANWATLYVDSAAVYALHEVGAYPLWEPVERLISRFGISEIQTCDIVRLVTSIIEKGVELEVRLGIDDIECVTGNCVPASHVDSRPEALRTHHFRLLMLILLFERVEKYAKLNRTMITRGLAPDVKSVIVQGDVLIEEDGDIVSATLAGEILACDRLSSLFRFIDPAYLALGSRHQDEVRVAILASVFQLCCKTASGAAPANRRSTE